MVTLTSLASDIVEAILNDSLLSGSTLFDFSDEVPLLWQEQRGAPLCTLSLGKDGADSARSNSPIFAVQCDRQSAFTAIATLLFLRKKRQWGF